MTGHEDGDALVRDPAARQRGDRPAQGASRVRVVVDEQDARGRPADPPEPPPLRAGQMLLRTNCQPLDRTLRRLAQDRGDERREIGSRGSNADDGGRFATPVRGAEEAARQGDRVGGGQVLAAQSFGNPHPSPARPLGKLRAGVCPDLGAQAQERLDGRQRGRVLDAPRGDLAARGVHATRPARGEPLEALRTDSPDHGTRRVDQELDEVDGGSEPSRPLPDRGQIRRTPREIVVDRARDRADEQVDVSEALLALPRLGQEPNAGELLLEAYEQVLDREPRIEAPLVRGEELRLGPRNRAGEPCRTARAHRAGLAPFNGGGSTGRARNRSLMTRYKARGFDADRE